MIINEKTLREHYKHIEDDKLLALYNTDTLTEIATKIISEELLIRGYTEDKIIEVNNANSQRICQDRIERETKHSLEGLENISFQYESASIAWWRALATIVDYIFIFVILIFYLRSKILLGIAELLSLLFIVLYYILCEWFFGKTIGKAIIKLSVVTIDGENPNLWQSIIRTVTRIIEVNPFLLGGIPAYISVKITQKNQRIGDIIAKTYVIRDLDINRDDIAPENYF